MSEPLDVSAPRVVAGFAVPAAIGAVVGTGVQAVRGERLTDGAVVGACVGWGLAIGTGLLLRAWLDKQWRELPP